MTKSASAAKMAKSRFPLALIEDMEWGNRKADKIEQVRCRRFETFSYDHLAQVGLGGSRLPQVPVNNTWESTVVQFPHTIPAPPFHLETGSTTINLCTCSSWATAHASRFETCCILQTHNQLIVFLICPVRGRAAVASKTPTWPRSRGSPRSRTSSPAAWAGYAPSCPATHSTPSR